MLGLQPSGEHLIVEPGLPSTLGHLALLDIPGRWAQADAFGRGKLTVNETYAIPVGTGTA